uniref:Glycosyltransferase 2-like domain-containing protein n=1 Tax=viral metagenome TaxID=1070528 RepID=A0A6C0KP63_9ZZZZ
MKYPFILFFRDDKYDYIDSLIKDNCHNLECTIHIINKKENLNKFYKQIYPLLVVFSPIISEYIDILSYFDNNYKNNNISNRIIHLKEFHSIQQFNSLVNVKYIQICSLDRCLTRPIFSIFTTSFNSFEKIMRAFNSLKSQTLENWEWVIIDDSPDDKNFNYLKNNLSNDSRIRLYKRHENNGYIGNVKNESISLCRGKYVLELDHDDEVLPFVLEESANLFDKQLDVGFIYMDFINIYENGSNFCYGDNICKGYGSYYCQKYNNKWVYVYNTPNINNITLSHLVCCPNHPRIWRKDVLLKIGNYCEYLPICDDYEIILRTALNTKIAKIKKMGYIQYMNNENNNFSLIRNAEINRIGPNFISPFYYYIFNIHDQMKYLGGYEDEKYLNQSTIIWKRDNYQHKYTNLIINNDYDKQYCIIGLDGLLKNIDNINNLYKNSRNDFIVLENKCSIEYLSSRLDSFGFNNMKCYTLIDEPEENLIKYFKLCYISINNYEIISCNIEKLKYNSNFDQRHQVINSLTNSWNKYLEIGVENGYTFSNTHFHLKVGIDPDPKYKPNNENEEILKMTSDEYFNKLNLYDENSDIISIDSDDCIDFFDVIFIDGMHHCENVLQDFNNSIKILNKDGIIFIDDCIPLNYGEQLKIPKKHYYENGVLKYGEEWTGDVWKFVYYLLKNYSDKINLKYFNNINYRGVVGIQISESFKVEVNIRELNNYDYFAEFSHYLELLNKNYSCEIIE